MATQPLSAMATADVDSRLFRALSDPCRLVILQELVGCCGRPRTVSQAAECCSVDMSVVSRHLATLRDAGIVESKKVGREVHYTVRYQELSKWLRTMANTIDSCCPLPDAERLTAAQPTEVCE